ncbi:MAG: sporulation protein YqfD [Clostridia bacterium]|nr:sporulation protein YqfD [Clostridia bacterium]
MLTKLTGWLIGSRDYFVPASHADKAARLLVQSGADFRRLHRREEGLTFTLPLTDSPHMEAIFDGHSIPWKLVCEHGFRRLLRRYRRRWGIPIGIGMFFAVICASGQFIWTMDVVGNDQVTETEILERLDALGCRIGTYIPSIDFDALHTEFLMSDDDIAWIAVNLRGTHATVEVREIVRPDFTIDEDTPYNLVAKEDGIVQSVDIYRGQAMVESGELVRAGDLLASGLEDTARGLKLVHARGKVAAEVKRTIKVEIPLETSEKVYTGLEVSEKSLKFFGISIKLFGNTGNLPAMCDKIEGEDSLRFFGEIEVPLSLHETVYREYELVTKTLTEEEASRQAWERLRRECRTAQEGCELLRREISAGIVDGAYVIECELGLLCDIAAEARILTDQPGQ